MFGSDSESCIIWKWLTSVDKRKCFHAFYVISEVLIASSCLSLMCLVPLSHEELWWMVLKLKVEFLVINEDFWCTLRGPCFCALTLGSISRAQALFWIGLIDRKKKTNDGARWWGYVCLLHDGLISVGQGHAFCAVVSCVPIYWFAFVISPTFCGESVCVSEDLWY